MQIDSFKILLFSILLSLLGFVTTVHADVRLPRLISSGMVLQRDAPVDFWGWAKPNEEVLVAINDSQLATKADENGNWKITFPAMKGGTQADIKVSAANEILLTDVVFGDVWVASGQSNMELTLARAEPRYAELVPNINNRDIRQFEVPDHYNFLAPQSDLAEGSWKSATPENIRQFSAVAYFFADNIYQHEGVPIGIINASLGGSPVEAWMSEEVLSRYPEPYQEGLRFRDAALIKTVQDSDQKRSEQWYSKLEKIDQGMRKGQPAWSAPSLDTSDWKTTVIPSYWGRSIKSENGSFDAVSEGEGVVWYRKKFSLTAEQVERQKLKPGLLVMGTIVDADYVYLNGEKIGNTTYMYPPRRYPVPAKLLRVGENILTVRMINNSGLGGFVLDKEYALHLDSEKIDLDQTWLFKRGARMPALASQTFVRWKPMGLFNGLIAPLTPYSIKGFIWSQGESNAGQADTYVKRFQDLISDWREKWGQGDLPFIYTQLSNYVSPGSKRDERGNWPELREAQSAALGLSNTAMAVTFDVGEWNDIHPLNKKTVGDRMAAAAHKLVYNRNVPFTGPVLKSHHVSGREVIVSFDHADGLNSENRPLTGFEIAGVDGVYYRAEAKIDGIGVTLRSDQVEKPRQLQYAWRNNPENANLINAAGFPASPFRVEDLTLNLKAKLDAGN